MIKQIIAIILLSMLIITTMAYAQQGLQLLLTAHDWVAQNLTEIFSGGEAGNLIRKLLALLTIPLIVGLVPVVIYWVAKRSWFPYFMHVIWVTWLVQTAALMVQFKVAG